jgi:hypothetical protein
MPLTCPRAPVCHERSRRSSLDKRRFSAGLTNGPRSGAAACWTALGRPMVLQALFAYLVNVAASEGTVWPAANGRCAPRAAARGALPFGHTSHEERCGTLDRSFSHRAMSKDAPSAMHLMENEQRRFSERRLCRRVTPPFSRQLILALRASRSRADVLSVQLSFRQVHVALYAALHSFVAGCARGACARYPRVRRVTRDACVVGVVVSP